MASQHLKKNNQHLKDIEEILEEENGKPNSRPVLRETPSRLNRPLPLSSLLQPLPEFGEDEDDLRQEDIDKPKEDDDAVAPRAAPHPGLGGGSASDIQFGFQTPSKRRGRPSLLQIAVTSSAQKRQSLMLEQEKSPPNTASKGHAKTTPKRDGGGVSTPPKTPKQGRGTAKAPRTPVTPSTPRVRRGTLLTPQCVPKENKVVGTPRSRRSLAPQLVGDDDNPPATPASFRKAVRNRIKEVAYDSASDEDEYCPSSQSDSSSSSEEEPSSPDNSEEEGEKRVATGRRGVKGRTPKSAVKPCSPPSKRSLPTPSAAKGAASTRRKRLRVDEDDEQADGSGDYFVHNDGSSTVVTSDHTLGRLAVPRLSCDALRSLIGQKAQDHPAQREALFQDHCAYFQKWMTLLDQGYSVFVHGVGSKKALLSLFQSQYLDDSDHLVVNGFFPSLTLKSILTSIIEEILCIESAPSCQVEQLQLLQRHYARPSASPLYLLVHNLDGAMLRASNTQRALSHLCSLPNVRLLASVDHINAPLVLDSRRAAEYNPVWFDCTTLAPYTEETSYENSLMVQQNSNLALSSLMHVFKSLTPSSKGIFLLIANYQLEHQQDGSYQGLAFPELYQRCRDAMLVNSDMTLRAQLTEFLDHKLLKQRKMHDGTEALTIPLESSGLAEFVDQQTQEQEDQL